MQGVFVDTATLLAQELDLSPLAGIRLEPSLTAAELPAAVATAEVILTNKVVIDAALMTALRPCLELIL